MKNKAIIYIILILICNCVFAMKLNNELTNLKISPKGAPFVGEVPNGVDREKLTLHAKQNQDTSSQLVELAFQGLFPMKDDVKGDLFIIEIEHNVENLPDEIEYPTTKQLRLFASNSDK